MSCYLEEFSSRASIEQEYGVKLADDVEILIAWYGYGSYCGNSFVLYRIGEQLYEVNGSHCSCFGLEGQWEPEETTLAALRHRAANGGFGFDDEFVRDSAGAGEAKQKLMEFLNEQSPKLKSVT
jgi:hypothetical protein